MVFCNIFPPSYDSGNKHRVQSGLWRPDSFDGGRFLALAIRLAAPAGAQQEEVAARFGGGRGGGNRGGFGGFQPNNGQWAVARGRGKGGHSKGTGSAATGGGRGGVKGKGLHSGRPKGKGKRQSDGETEAPKPALCSAAEAGDATLVKKLLAEGSGGDINEQWSVDGRTSGEVIEAAQGGHHEIVDQLLAAGAGVDATSNKGWTALHRAALRGHLAAVQALVFAGAHTAVVQAGSTALMMAVNSGHLDEPAAGCRGRS